MKDIAGIFDSRIEAERALNELLNRGFSESDISIIMSDKTKTKFFGDSGHGAAEGGLAGAALGGALGALAAALVAVGTVVIPGAGLVVAGPIVAALSGAGAGATVGGLAGALGGAGFDAAEASKFEDAVKAGKAVLVVQVDNEEESRTAHTVLASYNATTKAA